MDRPNAPRDKIGVMKVSATNCAIKTLRNEIDKAITIGSVDVKFWVQTRHFGEHGGKVGRT
ncbi:hypothetical protein D3C81_2082530 [compost metagenome]